MKLTAIIILSTAITASATGHSQTVTLDLKKAPIEKVFNEVSRQTGFSFMYGESMFKEFSPITIKVKDATVDDVLEKCFNGLPFSYSIEGNAIVIRQKEKSPNEQATTFNNEPPPIDVTGKVTDENGNPLAGASVKVKNSNKGTTTNNDGVFVLKGVSDDAVLEISYVGFEALSINVSNRSSIVTSLKAKPENLNEVVINKGYYTEKQRNSVGNVSHVDAKAIENQPVQNPLLALQGRTTGIQITQLTGLPGGGTTVQIQGRNSIRAGLDPLIVIDGVPFPSTLFGNGLDDLVQGGSPLNYINTNDIESIDVLKDADATSIYGSRAANGAILITTKKGKAGKTKLSINIQQGWGKVNRKVNMMNTRQYLDMRYEAYKNDGIDLNTQAISGQNYDLKLWDTTRNTDWQKVLIGSTAKYTNINATISGGNSNVQYLIGTTYRRQTTVFPGNYDDKVGGLHFNINSNSTDKKLSVQLSGSYLYDVNHLPNNDLTSRALLLEPNAPQLFNSDGSLNWAPNASGNSTWTNPLAAIYGADYNKTTKNLVTNLILNYTILPGWTVGSSLGYINMQNNNYSPVRIEGRPPERRATALRSASFNYNNQSSWIIEPQMRYDHKQGNGRVEGLIGASFQKNIGDLLSIFGTGYTNDQLMKSPASAPNKTVGANSSMYKYNAFFGRLNYNWKEKYILNLTGRRDGSSRFGDNNKFHNFASIGAVWIFTEEKFVERNIPFLSFGKIRGSYGTTGNDGIGDYLYLSTYSTNNPVIPYQGGTGLFVNGIPNPNLQWEETKKLQYGIDLGFLDVRILLGATYSRNVCSNQLIGYTLPTITGFNFINENFPATIRNTSWEFTLHTVNIKGKEFSWSTDFNLTIPKNKLISFPNIEKTSYYSSTTSGVIVGQPLGVAQVFQYGGVDPATGLYYPLDRNGQPVYSPNFPNFQLDKTALVSTLPKFYGGLINAFNYKSFQLEFVLQFTRQIGLDNFNYWNGMTSPGSFSSSTSNQPTTIVNKNRWQKPGDNAEIGRYSTNSFVWPSLSDVGYSYSASFTRLKNVSLSWQCPMNWIKRVGLQSATIYFRGENLATFTKYESLDPETRSNSTLPPLQMWTIGAKLDF